MTLKNNTNNLLGLGVNYYFRRANKGWLDIALLSMLPAGVTARFNVTCGGFHPSWHSRTEFPFPADAGIVKEADIGPSTATEIEVSSSITICMAVRKLAHWITGVILGS